MTEVRLPSASVVRSVSPAMFTDLCDSEAVFTIAGDTLVVTLPCDLDAGQVDAVRDRLVTSSAEREAQRAEIRALLAAGDTPLAEALTTYLLGDE